MALDALTAKDFFETCVCLGINRAARSVARRYDAMLKPIGITSGQFSILSSLRRPKPISIGRLAELLAMERTTLTRNLKPLEELGLVVVRADAEDRRVRCVALTPQGEQRLKEAIPRWRKAQSDSNRRIGAGHWDDLKPVLSSLSD